MTVLKEPLDMKASRWARQKHEETNHLYDGKKYEVHLWQVVDIAKMFIHYIPVDKREVVIAACWLHDTIEDCRVTYNDVKAEFGEEVAEIVYALTNEKGKTRKERANSKYYDGIISTPYADFVKICDRIANRKYSLETNGKMLSKYLEEANGFMLHVDPTDKYPAMRAYMDSLTTTK